MLKLSESLYGQHSAISQAQSFWKMGVIALREAVTEMRSELEGACDLEARSASLPPHDELGNLPNRLDFCKQLERALLSKPRFLTVIYIGLQGFGSLDERYGHGMGECLLHLVAARLLRAAPVNDRVGLMGRARLACLITGAATLEILDEKESTFHQAATDPFMMKGVPMSIRPGIGIARYPFDGLTSDELMAAADAAMRSSTRTLCPLIEAAAPVRGDVRQELHRVSL